MTLLAVAGPGHRAHHPRDLVPFAGRMAAPREIPARADVIDTMLAETGIPVIAPDPDVDVHGPLAIVHDPGFLAFLASAFARWAAAVGAPDTAETRAYVRPFLGVDFVEPDDVIAQLGRYSHDTDPVLAGTWDASIDAVRTAVTAAHAVADGRARIGYARTRPPGHHCSRASFGGYCYLNNLAVAAQALVDRGLRVATLDVDVHAGNGTQQIFEARADVLSVSIHVDPAVEYPFFGGRAADIGVGEGEGFTFNVPLPHRTVLADYRPALDRALGRIADHAPDVLLVALGVDTAAEDGIFSFGRADYAPLGAAVASLGVPLVVCQEGGYDLAAMPQDVRSFLVAAAGSA
jgi:acetoin utilization deacetylase AcuC-like enzyme